MEDITNRNNLSNGKEEELDLLEIVRLLCRNRKTIYKSVGAGVVIALIVAFSIPKEYTVSVTLSPESGNTGSSGLMGMASMFGLGDLSMGETDALTVSLFPDILGSTPFALELYNMPVKPLKSDTAVAFYQFIDEQRKPWWRYLFELPGKAIGGMKMLFQNGEETKRVTPDPFHLTKDEEMLVKTIKKSMTAEADKTTGITTVSVTLQDPVVTAVVADSVVCKLQEYITDYRTRKAIEDFNYQQKLYDKAKTEYYRLQQEYARYTDRNQQVVLQSANIEEERLTGQYELAYQIYEQAASQLEVLRAKIQEDKPVFAVVEPSSVPLRASAPKKMLILVGFVFLAFVGSSAWILFGKDLWEDVKKGIRG